MNKRWYWGILFFILSLFLLFSIVIYFRGDIFGIEQYIDRITAILFLAVGCLLFVILYSTGLLGWKKLGEKDFLSFLKRENRSEKKIKQRDEQIFFSQIKKYLYARYGFFWRYRLKKCLVIGQASDVDNLLPELSQQGWQIGDNTVMIYGGEPQAELDESWLKALKKSCGRLWLIRRRPIDAVIWVMAEDYLAAGRQRSVLLENSMLKIRERNKLLRWEAPLYLVDTRHSAWPQTDRVEQSVAALFSAAKHSTIDDKMAVFAKLSVECSERGMQQVMGQTSHAFLLQLAQDLADKDKPRLQNWLTQWGVIPRAARLRGLFFMPPNNPVESEQSLLRFEHHFVMVPTWQGICDDSATQGGRRVGFQWEILSCGLILVCSVLSAIGVVTAYYNNQQLIEQSRQIVNQIQQDKSANYTQRLMTQYALQQQLGQLIYRQQESAPLSYRFGLSQNDPLLEVLWPYYEQINQQNIAGPLRNWSRAYLTELTAMSPADPNRAKWINSGYEVLKGYLMLGLPAKTDGQYLSQFASKMWPAPEPIAVGEWQRMMPELVRFWGENVGQHPQWAMKNDAQLIKDVRQILINQIGLQNAGDTIYSAIMQQAGQNYADVSLTQLLNGIDSRMLFSSSEEVPGIYTRKAWEDLIKKEIGNAAKSRQEQIDWVLSDGGEQATLSISPDVLRQQLTNRYFSDYSAAWLQFLNDIQWRQANNVSDVIEQLTLLSDTRQSPLVALMNVVKYQAEVAYTGGGLSDNLLRSAQELIKDKNPADLLDKAEASGPLTPTFGPILNLLNADNRNDLSLQTYLMRVTQVRLKLQNITSSANPQAMAQSLAKSVFQGTSVDLTDTRDYGNLIAANLGEEWSGFGYSMFKQPLEQAWQVILTPATKSFNDTWQSRVVANFENSFAGRYPFKDSANDASLAELARFLRPDSGVIDKFIAQELGGILHKQGDSWIIDPVNSQGLRFSQSFIEALDLFNSLSSQLFASGDAKMEFDLMARSGGGVVHSELFIDKQKLNYFNQMPVWQRFRWPGDDYSPYAELNYNANEAGLLLYDYQAGDFGFIRLLERAFVRQLDSSRYELIWKAPNDINLKYILRTQSGDGPLILLKLRNFSLPKKVFDME